MYDLTLFMKCIEITSGFECHKMYKLQQSERFLSITAFLIKITLLEYKIETRYIWNGLIKIWNISNNEKVIKFSEVIN